MMETRGVPVSNIQNKAAGHVQNNLIQIEFQCMWKDGKQVNIISVRHTYIHLFIVNPEGSMVQQYSTINH